MGDVREASREALGRGAMVVTSNERAARVLRIDYDEARRASGSERWEPARVMSWTAWTGSLWRKMLIDGRTSSLLMNPVQEHAVWRRVLASDDGAQGLRGIDSLAEMAADAWRRLWTHAEPERTKGGGQTKRMSARLGGVDGSGDLSAFARWARAFEERCEAESLVSGAELDASLATALRERRLQVEDELLLVGFDELTPVRQRLVDAMRAARVEIGVADSGVLGGRRMLTSAADEMDELRACARWAAARIAGEHGARVAVIVPDLRAERAAMERVFREVMAPELEAIDANEAEAPYEFSLGRSLAESPMVAVALHLLGWAAAALPIERVSGLLLSEYFAGRPEERSRRAEFDAFELRTQTGLRPEISVAGLERMLAGSRRRSAGLPVLLAALRRMGRAGGEFGGGSRSYGEWAQAVRELLSAAGWGAAGAETTVEFQTRERWESALDLMATLDFDDQPVDYAAMLDTIERIAQETVFAPESRGAAVQVMGPMEAAGSEFDAVWLLRGGEMSWPVMPTATPLLRWGLQRDLGMPGTDAVRDQTAAQRVMERIAGSGHEVVVSYARSAGEGRQRASGVVRAMRLGEVALAEISGPEPERTLVEVERVVDAVEVQPLRDGAVRGGVRALELQAACGFLAFAEQRLRSTGLEERVLGLNSRENGTAVHVALERFWTEVGTQAALLRMSAGERAEVLARAIDGALETSQKLSAGAWDEAYLRMQRRRLGRLLEGWLQMEMRRPAFAVKERETKREDVQIGPLRMSLRVDRVDVVGEAEVLIDYKTGAAKPPEWMGSRPDSPQLPLYAVLAARALAGADGSGAEREVLGGVAFGNVRPGKNATLRGIAGREGLLRGRLGRMDEGTFEQQVESWGRVLEGLADEFAAGDARVDPKSYPLTCRHCEQRMLCRLDTSLLEEVEEVEIEEGEGG